LEEKVYRQALSIFDNDTMLSLRLAEVCEKSARIEEAAEFLHRALMTGKLRVASVHSRKTDEQLIIRLGELYKNMARPTEAEKLWQEFLKAKPGSLQVRRLLSQLRHGTSGS
jgi:hypothetical protein